MNITSKTHCLSELNMLTFLLNQLDSCVVEHSKYVRRIKRADLLLLACLICSQVVTSRHTSAECNSKPMTHDMQIRWFIENPSD